MRFPQIVKVLLYLHLVTLISEMQFTKFNPSSNNNSLELTEFRILTKWFFVGIPSRRNHFKKQKFLSVVQQTIPYSLPLVNKSISSLFIDKILRTTKTYQCIITFMERHRFYLQIFEPYVYNIFYEFKGRWDWCHVGFDNCHNVTYITSLCL